MPKIAKILLVKRLITIQRGNLSQSILQDDDYNYLYDDDIDFIYGVMDKFYTRVRTIRRSLPKEIKEVGLKGMPSLREISQTPEDDDSHLSDWEIWIRNRWMNVKKLQKNYI